MKIASKVRWLLWLTVGWLAILLPLAALAQEDRTDLSLSLASGSYYNKVTAAKDNRFFLEVRNIGTRAITNIRLSSEKPEGWVIEFKPGEIAYLGPGSVQTVDINVRPAYNTAKGEYTVTVVAEARELRKASIIWFTVESGRAIWLWVGVALVAAVVAAFVAIFLHSSRE